VPDTPATLSETATSLADTPTTLADTLSSVPVDAVTAIPPMHYGDLAAAGLTNWWPSGICAWALEAIHVSTGMPWFWTIAAGAVLTRVVLLPFTIKNLKNAAIFAEHQDEMKASRDQISAAYRTRNQFEVQKATLAQRALFERMGVHPLKQFVTALAQIPVTIGMFFAVKNICQFPVEQLKIGGIGYITDLTAPDPYLILPILSAVAMNIQLSVRWFFFLSLRRS
jgi:YidC/Oxa1 family membrane protein insertase